jgi:hypothetical protein
VRQPIVIGMLLLGGVLLWQRARAGLAALLVESPYPIYLASALLVLVLTIGKSGSSTNYLFELLLALLIWIVYALGTSTFPHQVPRAVWIATLVLLAGCAIEPWAAWRATYRFVDAQRARGAAQYCALLRREVQSLGIDTPLILNPVTHSLAYAVGGRVALNDPEHYYRMWNDGLLDVDPFLQSIHAREYDIVMIPYKALEDRSPPPLRKRIIEAVRQSYRPVGGSLDYVYFVRP